jgi:hypothetical protein
VQFVGGEGLTATLIVPYVEFVLTEVLKNAMQVRTPLLCAVHQPFICTAKQHLMHLWSPWVHL